VHLAVLEGVLGTLTAEGVSIRRRTSGEPVRGFPPVRERACRLLGELASEGAREALLASVSLEEDLAVRLAALAGLGRIGLDGDGRLGYLISREAARPQADERVVLAGLEALFRVLSAGPSSGHPADYRALAELASWERSSRVRERAREMLGELKRRLP
jgi:HEAT repeat protein